MKRAEAMVGRGSEREVGLITKGAFQLPELWHEDGFRSAMNLSITFTAMFYCPPAEETKQHQEWLTLVGPCLQTVRIPTLSKTAIVRDDVKEIKIAEVGYWPPQTVRLQRTQGWGALSYAWI
jgi:hypothetical protein